MDTAWAPLTIDEVRTRFAEASVPWWIAGGHAIDLFLGWQTRPHADIDIEMFRSDRDALFDVFAGWDLQLMTGGELIPFSRGQAIAGDVFGVWARPGPDEPWAVEIMLADGDLSEWQFRRDTAITMAGDQLLRHTPDGVPYCTPEVQLLYKSKMARPKDDVDLARCLHRLAPAQRDWLAIAISRSQPDHPWVIALRGRNTGSMNES